MAKGVSEQTLLRRRFILDMLPSHSSGQRGMSVAQVTDLLPQHGCACSARTVQRDLEALHEGVTWKKLGVDLHREPADTPRGTLWSHAPGAKWRFLSALNREQALVLSLVEQELQHFLPQSAIAEIRAYLRDSERMLEQPANAAFKDFRLRVRNLPEGPERTVERPVLLMLGEINEALLHGVQLDARYAKREQVEHYRLHPVALVRRGLYHWLLAIKDNGSATAGGVVQSFRLDRMRGVTMLRHEPAARGLPTLQQVQAQGKLELFATGSIKLLLRFSPEVGGMQLCDSFRDAPLGKGQRIFSNPVGGYDLETEVVNSLELKLLLQRYADRIQVLEPPSLQTHLRDFSRAAMARQQA